MSSIAMGQRKLVGIDNKLTEEKDFIGALYQFMRDRCTPIERIPSLGFKQIDLFLFYKIVQRLGGSEQVTLKQAWRQVYNELGGNPRSTSAATCTRKHYEKLILPYERHLLGVPQIAALPPKPVKRFSRGLNPDPAPGEPVTDPKKPRLQSPSWKETPYSTLRSKNGLVVRCVPQTRDHQQLWRQQHACIIPLSGLRKLAKNTLSAHGARSVSSKYSNCGFGEQRGTLKRSLVQLWEKRTPAESLRLRSNESPEVEWQEQPLNLSSKGRSSEPSRVRDTFSAPACTSPKFLNHVSSLYSPRRIQKIEGPLKSCAHAPPARTQDGASVFDNSVRTRLCSPLANYHKSPNDRLEPESFETQSSMDLPTAHFCKLAPTGNLTANTSERRDIRHQCIMKAQLHELAMRFHPAAQRNPAALRTSQCNVSQVEERSLCQKAESLQQIHSDPFKKTLPDIRLYSMIKPNRFNDLCDAYKDVAENGGINRPECGLTKEGLELTVTSIPAFRTGLGQDRNRLYESCQLHSRGMSTLNEAYRNSTSLQGVLNTVGSHLERDNITPHATSPRPAPESGSMANIFGNTIVINTLSRETPANELKCPEVRPVMVSCQEGIQYHNMKSNDRTQDGMGALQKYLPLEFQLKHLSGAYFGSPLQAIPSSQQRPVMWNQRTMQGQGPGSLPRKEINKLQTFTPHVVS